MAALRQLIFDSLGDIRRTPDGNMGRQTRVTVKLPFHSEAFQAFRDTNSGIAESGNVNTYLTTAQVTAAIGEGWQSRGYKTSTETFVSAKELVHLTWGYSERKDYNHTRCKRQNVYSIYFIFILDLKTFIKHIHISSQKFIGYYNVSQHDKFYKKWHVQLKAWIIPSMIWKHIDFSVISFQ